MIGPEPISSATLGHVSVTAAPLPRRSARALLEAEGFDVVGEAADGETALAEAARLRPGLVLPDVQLPDLDGFEVAARLAS